MDCVWRHRDPTFALMSTKNPVEGNLHYSIFMKCFLVVLDLFPEPSGGESPLVNFDEVHAGGP